MDDDRARHLLSGPRGRRFVAELLDEPLLVIPELGIDWRAEVRRRAAATDPAAAVEEDRLVAAVADSVARAAYWQEPDAEDRVLADAAVVAELLPLAGAATAAPATRWWSEPSAARAQQLVAWPDSDGSVGTPRFARRGPGLAAWREETVEDERRVHRERPSDPRASWSGSWWSLPHLSGCVVTRPLPEALDWVEDGFGWQSGRSWPVSHPPAARVLEITGPADWVELVERFPLVVTASRRHDWWRVTGWNRGWAIPDWPAVAEAFDAVHLTVDGYLATAGRGLDVRTPDGPAGTVLAGWDPGTTWWLTDVVPGPSAPTDWRRTDDRWEPVG